MQFCFKSNVHFEVHGLQGISFQHEKEQIHLKKSKWAKVTSLTAMWKNNQEKNQNDSIFNTIQGRNIVKVLFYVQLLLFVIFLKSLNSFIIFISPTEIQTKLWTMTSSSSLSDLVIWKSTTLHELFYLKT